MEKYRVIRNSKVIWLDCHHTRFIVTPTNIGYQEIQTQILQISCIFCKKTNYIYRKHFFEIIAKKVFTIEERYKIVI